MNGLEYSIRFIDIHSLRVCYKVAQEYPEYLEYSVLNSNKVSCAKNEGSINKADIEVATGEYINKITHGLDTFLLKLKRIKGEALLDYMIKLRKRNDKKGDNKTKVPSYLAVDINKEHK